MRVGAFSYSYYYSITPTHYDAPVKKYFGLKYMQHDASSIFFAPR